MLHGFLLNVMVRFDKFQTKCSE